MPPLLLELQSSRIFAVILIFIYGGALICLNLSSISIWLKIILTLFITVSFLMSLNKFILFKSAEAIMSIKTDKKNQWSLIKRSGEVVSARLYGDSICTRWLVILNFRLYDVNKRLSLLIFSDSADAEAFRRLRAYLRVISRNM